MLESQIKTSERTLVNNPNIKTKSEAELKANLIKELEEQIKSLDHEGNGFGILVSNITGFVSGYNFLLNDYKKLLEQAKAGQLTYKQLNDQYLALGKRLSGVAESSDNWALGSQVVKSTTETGSVLVGKAIGGVAGGTAAGTFSSGLNSLASNITSASIGVDTFDIKKVGIETGQGFIKSAITAGSFRIGEVSGAASANALVKALPANSISPKILNLFGGTVGGFTGGGFGNGAGQINEMAMSKFGLSDKKEFDWNSFGLSLSFGGLGGAVGSQFGHSVPGVIADGLSGTVLGLGELAANNGGSLQGIPKEEFANTIAQNLVNPFIGKATAHHNYSNPQNLIKSPEAVSAMKRETTEELLKITNDHTLNNNPEKYIEFIIDFVKNATDEQLDNVSYNHFEEFFSKLESNKLSESTINKTFEFLELCSLKESDFVKKVIDSLFENEDNAWKQLVKYNPDKAFGALNTIASKHGSQERALIYKFENYADKDKLSPEVKASIVLTLSSKDFQYHSMYYQDRTMRDITSTLFEHGVLKQSENNKYFEALKEFIGRDFSTKERKNYLQELLLRTPVEQIKNKQILDLFANYLNYPHSLDINLYSKLTEINPARVWKELYDNNFDKNLQYIYKKEIREIAVEVALRNPKEEYAQKIISETILNHYFKYGQPEENNQFAKLIENCSGENLWNLVLDNVYNISETYLYRDELISKLENNINTLKVEKYKDITNYFFQRFGSSRLKEEESIKIKSLKEKLSQRIIQTENITPEILLDLFVNYPESGDLIASKHFNSFDQNTIKSFANRVINETDEHNFELNKIFLQKIILHLGKEEVLNILLENRETTLIENHDLKTMFKDKLIFELGLADNGFLGRLKWELNEYISLRADKVYDEKTKTLASSTFSILVTESNGQYLKDLIFDKLHQLGSIRLGELISRNIKSLDYLKAEDFDPERLSDEQSEILYDNFKHIYKETKSTELVNKLQPLTQKLFVKYNPDLLEKAKTDTVETMRNDDYSIFNKAFSALDGIIKNGLEQYSINNPNRFFSLFSDDFKTYKSTGLNDFIKSLLLKVIKNSSDKLVGGEVLDLSNITITEDLKIQGLPNLKRINLSSSSLPEGFSLKNLPNLESTNLSGAKIPKGFNLENLPNLEKIYLNNTNLPESFNLKDLPNLRNVELSNSELSEGFNLQDFPNLEKIYLSNAKLNEGFSLKGLPNLRNVDLPNVELPKNFNLENLPNLETVNLSGAGIPKNFSIQDTPNLKSLNLQNATISSESINIIDYLNPNNTELILKFLQSSLEVEDSYKAYKQVLQKNNNTEGLKEIVKNIVLDYISTEQTDLKTLNILEKLYINSEINPETGKQNKAFPQIEKVLSQIRKENSKNNVLNYVISTITDSNKLSRNRSINALNVIKSLPKESQEIYFNILSQSKNEERNNIVSNLASFNIGSKLSTNPSEILTKYLSLDTITNKLTEIINNSKDSKLLYQIIATNIPKLDFDTLKILESELNLELRIDNTKYSSEEAAYRALLPKALNTKIQEGKLDSELLQNFINSKKLLISDSLKQKLLAQYLPEILTNLKSDLYKEVLASIPYLNEVTKINISNTINPEYLEYKYEILGYLTATINTNPKIITEILPIIKPLLDKLSEPTKKELANIDKTLIENFDQRFKTTHKYSWLETMKQFHPNFNQANLRGNFEMKFGEYTIKAANTLEYIMNGQDVNSFMCTVLGQFNQHLTLGTLANMNNLWYEIFDKEGNKMTGFDGRILMDGSLLLGSQYTYGNNKSRVQGFEQALTNEYAKHIGINKIVLPDGIVENPDIEDLGGVESYMESGNILIPEV